MKLWADFNEAYEGEIWTSLRRAKRFIPQGEPSVGQWVELWDHEGNSCWGVVTSVSYPIVFLELDESTWHDGDTVRIQPEFVDSAPSSGDREETHTGVEKLPVGGLS